jgi:hypothetical protein
LQPAPVAATWAWGRRLSAAHQRWGPAWPQGRAQPARLATVVPQAAFERWMICHARDASGCTWSIFGLREAGRKLGANCVSATSAPSPTTHFFAPPLPGRRPAPSLSNCWAMAAPEPSGPPSSLCRHRRPSPMQGLVGRAASFAMVMRT